MGDTLKLFGCCTMDLFVEAPCCPNSFRKIADSWSVFDTMDAPQKVASKRAIGL
jgi:hypothetical protein